MYQIPAATTNLLPRGFKTRRIILIKHAGKNPKKRILRKSYETSCSETLETGQLNHSVCHTMHCHAIGSASKLTLQPDYLVCRVCRQLLTVIQDH